MKADICTIPISEIFDPREGCPYCRMFERIDRREVEFIMGSAKMEPSIRIKTNETGFCPDHLEKMHSYNSGRGLAIILETRLKYLAEHTLKSDKPGIFRPTAGRRTHRIIKSAQTCFVCDRVEWTIHRMLEQVCRMYDKERDFRALYAEQPVICVPHYAHALEYAEKYISKRWLGDFRRVNMSIIEKNIADLRGDLRHYCGMFDYRNQEKDEAELDWGNSKDSVERTVKLLTSKSVK